MNIFSKFRLLVLLLAAVLYAGTAQAEAPVPAPEEPSPTALADSQTPEKGAAVEEVASPEAQESATAQEAIAAAGEQKQESQTAPEAVVQQSAVENPVQEELVATEAVSPEAQSVAPAQAPVAVKTDPPEIQKIPVPAQKTAPVVVVVGSDADKTVSALPAALQAGIQEGAPLVLVVENGARSAAPTVAPAETAQADQAAPATMQPAAQKTASQSGPTAQKATTPSSGEMTAMPPIGEMIANFCHDTGLRALLIPDEGGWTNGIGRLIMIGVGLILVYLAIAKGFEPLLLLPIGFGTILTNIPLAGMNDQATLHLLNALSGGEVDLQFGGLIGGMLSLIYAIGIKSGAFPLIIFMGIGALTDFGPLLANPKTAFLGAAAQLGIFATLLGALLLPGIHFNLLEAASIGIIGGADGPTSIFLSSRLAPHLLGPIAVAAYSYMALVPIIQPPIMRFLTTKEERQIRMEQLRPVSKLEKIIFPVVVLGLCALLIPSAAPLIGFFMFGNLMKECGVVGRLSDTAQNALLNIVTIFLGLGVGAQMTASLFLSPKTLGILVLGVVAFSIGTAGGILMAKMMNLLPGPKVNPLIGSAGVSAVPMAARVSHKLGMEADPTNMLLMHAMGPNVAGVIGSAVAAGVLLTLGNM